MLKVTEHLRRVENPNVTCCYCEGVIMPGTRYRHLVAIDEDWSSVRFYQDRIHVGCIHGDRWYSADAWRVQKPEPPWEPPPLADGLTADEQHILLHTLGMGSHIETSRHGYRNHYCANAGDERLESLADRGLMIRGGTINDGRHQYYAVTKAGAALVGRPDLGVEVPA